MFTSGYALMDNDKSNTRRRSLLFSGIINQRTDVEQQKVIADYEDEINFHPLDELMISNKAWDHVKKLDIQPKFVFAHPDMLQAHPKTSLYYRGIALLSRKRVAQIAVPVTEWEEGTRTVLREQALKVAQFYNAIISSIIEGSTNWTLENGYRNILATIGVTLDGMYRNKIGELAEDIVKSRIFNWLKDGGLIISTLKKNEHQLPKGILMRYGSEPDIAFLRSGKLVATIEVKGGTDPAGALERLGAMTKSFTETPANCMNFLVAGVVTPEMESRLKEMSNVKVYNLNDLSDDDDRWGEFADEIFHYTLRIT